MILCTGKLAETSFIKTNDDLSVEIDYRNSALPRLVYHLHCLLAAFGNIDILEIHSLFLQIFRQTRMNRNDISFYRSATNCFDSYPQLGILIDISQTTSAQRTDFYIFLKADGGKKQ